MASRVPFALLAAIAFGARMDQKLDDSDALNAKLDSLRSDMHAEFKDHMKKLEVEMADERKVLHARLAELDARVAQLETRTASEAATVEEDCADCILNHFAPKEGSQYYQSLCGWMSELPSISAWRPVPARAKSAISIGPTARCSWRRAAHASK